ncbi:MAG: hypothetical protein JWO22_2407 [Frankiales bacterium]|nr:hypothetical protein [Frankiales bacterium]
MTMRTLIRSRTDPLFRLASGALGRWAWDQTPVPGALVFDVLDLARDHIVPPASTLGLRSVPGLEIEERHSTGARQDSELGGVLTPFSSRRC